LAFADTPSGMAHSAAADLAGRPRARDEAARAASGDRLPRLVRLVLWCVCGSRRDRLGRGRRFRCGLGPCGSRLRLVFLKTAVFVFAA
jgi:hypothetical protein